MSSNSQTIYAIIFGLIGTFLSALSLILMKYAHNLSEKPFLTKYWILGFICLLLGSASNIQALNYGNVVLLACTSSISIVFNTLFAILILNEKLTTRRILGIIIICTGSSLFIWNAKNDKIKIT